MARLKEKQVSIARVYSQAMLGLAGSGANDLLDELEGLVGLLDSNDELRQLFSSPLVDPREREKAIESMFRGRASDLLVDSLQVLNRHGRLTFLDTIVELYRQEAQEQEGNVDVHVTTAVPLGDGVKKELEALAKRLYGRRPDLVETVDPALIGGLVVRVGDRKIDTSVATQLRTMRQQLEERAAHEIHRSRQAVEGSTEASL